MLLLCSRNCSATQVVYAVSLPVDGVQNQDDTRPGSYSISKCQRLFFTAACSQARRMCVIPYIDLLNFVFLRDCPSLASQSSNFRITCGTFPAFLCFRNTKRQYEYLPVLLHQVCTYHQILRRWITCTPSSDQSGYI